VPHSLDWEACEGRTNEAWSLQIGVGVSVHGRAVMTVHLLGQAYAQIVCNPAGYKCPK
jgi:hypothetical protein